MEKEKEQYKTPELVEHENLNKVTKGQDPSGPIGGS